MIVKNKRSTFCIQQPTFISRHFPKVIRTQITGKDPWKKNAGVWIPADCALDTTCIQHINQLISKKTVNPKTNSWPDVAVIADMEPLYGESNVNHLCAKFFTVNINIYLHFMSLLHIDMTQEVEILPQVRQVQFIDASHQN